MRISALWPPAALVMPGTTEAQELGNGAVVFQEEGRASFYGKGFDGKPTASGETFDQDAMTAAHPKLPLGTEVTVTAPSTGKQVEVEINDRGPYVGGRAIDLSQGAATRLGSAQEGVAEVKIEATKQQAEQAIDKAADVPKVERQLEDARDTATTAGTPLQQPLPPLASPAP
jgi:rare lipoprotein A